MTKEEAKAWLDACTEQDGCPYCAGYTVEDVIELFNR